MAKNYTIIIKINSNTFVKYRQVHSLPRFYKFMGAKFKEWKFINIYDRETRQKLASYTKGNLPIYQ